MTDPRAALGDGSRSTQLTFRRRWEDAAMKIVCAVKRDLVPDMDDNDGGQLLVWILDLCEQVGAAVPSAPRPAVAGYWQRCARHVGAPDADAEACAACATYREAAADEAVRAPRLEPEGETPCAVCGNEERHARTGLHTCECPAPLSKEVADRIRGAARALRDPLEPAPIPLNAEQEQAANTWAADDRLWTTQDTVAFNLRTFARVILAAARSALPASRRHSSILQPAGETCPDGEAHIYRCLRCEIPATWPSPAANLRPDDVIERCAEHPQATHELVCAACLREESVQPQRQAVRDALEACFYEWRWDRQMWSRVSRAFDTTWPEVLRAARPRVPEPDLLAAWREQDQALQDIFGECGEDAPISCPGDVFTLVKRTLEELRATTARVPEPDLERIEQAYQHIGTFVDSLDASGDSPRTAYLDEAWQAIPKMLAELRMLRAARAGAEAPPPTTKNDDQAPRVDRSGR